MSFIGTVTDNGTVALPAEAKLPAGTRVRVEPVADDKRPIGKKLLALAGVVNDWPHDFAENHDHYLHGLPKRNNS
jgi:hypothetical protein